MLKIIKIKVINSFKNRIKPEVFWKRRLIKPRKRLSKNETHDERNTKRNR